MPRYYFLLRDGGIVRDHEGEELADDTAARAVALQVFAETVSSHAEHLDGGGAYEVLVIRDAETPIYAITAQGRRLETAGD